MAVMHWIPGKTRKSTIWEKQSLQMFTVSRLISRVRRSNPALLLITHLALHLLRLDHYQADIGAVS